MSKISKCLAGFLVLAASPIWGQHSDGLAPSNTHILKPTPETVVWGCTSDGKSKPVLKIKLLGEIVAIQTLLAGLRLRKTLAARIVTGR